ncbi:hypothetical protein PYW07_009618 [Mythimna separata]|uniref:Regulatory protein zeste n=1 Tax=Mythimna separata TaxID=271217 RepID=A0AAD7YBV4_MYTSE|nr:hypothetical protein PYW07_009618 [Mythimna separata]
MRTSQTQFEMMVEFMEANGDLSKPSGGPRGRNFINMKWKDLTNKLNSEGTGESRSEEKWRKVWSDYKNNCKKKCAKINRAVNGTGGGPALQLTLTDLENRVMQLIGVQAATGMVVEEAGFQWEAAEISLPSEMRVPDYEIDWNIPGTSSQPTVAPPPPPSPPDETPALPSTEADPPSHEIPEETWKPPPQKKAKAKGELGKMFLEADRKAREYARERDRAYEELEKERLRIRTEELRVRELEMQERVRQRDDELRLQAKWLDFMREAKKSLRLRL